MLASVGAAGVPGTGLIMLTLVLTQLGLPLEVVGFVAGVDPIPDRMRTMTNISGDLAVTTLVAKWNGGVDFTEGTRAAAGRPRSETTEGGHSGPRPTTHDRLRRLRPLGRGFARTRPRSRSVR